MFVPSDGALVAALEKDGSLLQIGYEKVLLLYNTNTYVTALRAAGTIKVVDGKVVTSYVNGKTTPLNDKYKPTPALDSEGNLWLAQSYKSSTKSGAVLPRDKFLSATAPVPGDWYVSNIPGMDVSAFKASSFVISKGTDIKVFSSGAFGKAVFMWNNKGDITNTNPDKISFSQFKSTDYKAIKWDYVFTLNAMSDGEVWMGYDAGAIKFDPSHAWDPDFRVARILLPVDGLQVNALCEEPDGTKWVGTNMDGIYHMSADGTQVLKHFNTDNSVLQSNQIYSMCYYPDNKSLVIVTSNGVVEYFSDASAEVGEDSKVIVTPNPVRPDFTGFVTVMGLKNDAQVAITDATGRAWYESTATAGKCEWDCCDSNGARVPAGNYTVVVNGTAAATFLVLK